MARRGVRIRNKLLAYTFFGLILPIYLILLLGKENEYFPYIQLMPLFFGGILVFIIKIEEHQPIRFVMKKIKNYFVIKSFINKKCTYLIDEWNKDYRVGRRLSKDDYENLEATYYKHLVGYHGKDFVALNKESSKYLNLFDVFNEEEVISVDSKEILNMNKAKVNSKEKLFIYKL